MGFDCLATSVALVFALSGDIGFVAQVTNFAVFTLFVVVNASLIRLRMLHPEWPRPFRAGPSIGPVPLPPLVGLGGAFGLAVFMDRGALLVGVAALALGVLLSLVIVRRDAFDQA